MRVARRVRAARVGADREDQREDQEVRQHRGVAGAEEGRHDARERQRAEHAGGDQQHLERDQAAESQREDRSRSASAERTAARYARATRKPKSTNTAATPRKPHSSPIAGSTRSVLPGGNHRGIAPARARSRSDRRWRRPTARARAGRRRGRRCPTARATCGCGRPPCAAGPCDSPTATEPTIRTRPASASPGRPRATANIARKTKKVTSAGPRSFSTKKNTSEIATAHSTGHDVLQARHADAPEESREDALLAEVAQALPVAREVSGEEQDQQNLDELHRLERAEIDLRVVAGRAFAEREQQAEERRARRTAACSTSRRAACSRTP